jgi:hypothetical protein
MQLRHSIDVNLLTVIKNRSTHWIVRCFMAVLLSAVVNASMLRSPFLSLTGLEKWASEIKTQP